MILSLLVYSLLAVVLWLLAKDQLGRNTKNTFWTWQNISAIMLFATIYGVRYNVGVDHLMYVRIYQALQRGIVLREETLEPGYQFFQQLFVDLELHYSVFIGLWGALQIGLIYYAMRRDKYLLPLIGMFIVLGPAWLSWANIMRQAVAECAFVFIIEYIVNKRIWLYIIGVSLCVLVHKSAILLFPFYFLLQKPLFPTNKWIGAGCIVLCTLIGMTPTWISSIGWIEGVLEFLEYDSYTSQFDEIMEDTDNYRAWGPSRAGLWGLYLLTAWTYLTLRTNFRFEKRYDIYFTCFFWGNCLYELFANTSQIFIRPLHYFLALSIVVVPICIFYSKRAKKDVLYRSLCVLAFFNTFWWTIKAFLNGGKGENAFEVYTFFFMQ